MNLGTLLFERRSLIVSVNDALQLMLGFGMFVLALITLIVVIIKNVK